MAEITRITIIENENWKDKAKKFIHIKRQIWESAKLQVVRNYRMDEQLKKFWIFFNLPIWKIPKISNLEK